MARNILNLNFNLRNPSSTDETPINLIIRYNNQRFIYSTAENVNPKFWENDKTKKGYQRVKQTSSFPEYPEFNSRLDNIENVIGDVFRRYKNDNGHEVPTVKKFRELLDEAFARKQTAPKNLVDYVEFFIKKSADRTNARTGRLISKLTIKKYNTVLKRLKAFCDYTGQRIQFEDVDLSFYDQYKSYLISQHNHSTNTIAKEITTLKVFLNDATEKGVNKNLVFRSGRFSAASERSDSIYLNSQELLKLHGLDLKKNTSFEISEGKLLLLFSISSSDRSFCPQQDDRPSALWRRTPYFKTPSSSKLKYPSGVIIR